MPYRIMVSQVHEPQDSQHVLPTPTPIYEQVVEELDMAALVATINRKKRAPRTPKAKAAA